MVTFNQIVRGMQANPVYNEETEEYVFASKSHAIMWLIENGKTALRSTSGSMRKAEMLVSALSLLDS